MSNIVDSSLQLLLEAAVKALFLALVAATLLIAFRVRNSNICHRVWSVVLIAMLGLPLLQRLVPTVSVPTSSISSWSLLARRVSRSIVPAAEREQRARASEPIRATDSMSEVTETRRDDKSIGHVDDKTSVLTDGSRVTNTTSQGASASVTNTAVSSISVPWRRYLFVIYSVGLTWSLFRLGLGVWAARRLTAQSRPINAAGHEVFECNLVHVPLTLGIFRPRILLPTDWAAWNADFLANVLRHEQTHIDRGDNLVSLLAEINRGVYWFHPLAWYLRQRLAGLAEATCDDLVIATTGDRFQYAEHLLQVANRVRGLGRRVVFPGASMARTTQVESRIDSILDTSRPLAQQLSWSATGALAVVCIPLICVTAGIGAATNANRVAQDSVDQQTIVIDTAATTSIASAPQKTSSSPNDTAGHNDVWGDPLPTGAIARLGTTRYRHPGWYKRIAFLPDNESFVVGTNDNTVRAWNALTGKCTHEIDLGDRTLQAFCLSWDGRQLVALSRLMKPEKREHAVRLTYFDTNSWHEINHFEWNEAFSDATEQLAFSPDGKILAMGSNTGAVRVVDVATSREIRKETIVRGHIQYLTFSPNGECIAAAGNQEVVVWEFLAGKVPQKLSGLSQGGYIRFLPDGKQFVMGRTFDGPARIYDTATWELIRQLEVDGDNNLGSAFCLTPDGKQLVAPGRKWEYGIFDIATGRLEKSFGTGNERNWAYDVAVSADGRFLVGVGGLAGIQVWDLQSGQRLSDQFIGHLERPFEMLFAGSDQQLITGSMDESIRLWDAKSGKQLRAVTGIGWVAGLSLSPPDRWLASCSLDDSVRLWDFITWQEKYHFNGHGRTGGNQTTEVAFSIDGKKFFSFGGDMYLRVYSTENGRILAEHAIRPSGEKIEEDENGNLRSRMDPFGTGGSFQMLQAKFARDGTMLLVSGEARSAIHWFAVNDGQERDVTSLSDRLQDFTISPNGKFLVTFEQSDKRAASSSPRPVRTSILRLRTFEPQKAVQELELPGNYSMQAAFSSDSQRIAITLYTLSEAAKTTQRISILNLKDLKEIARVDNIGQSVRGLALSHDGVKLATSLEDSSVVLWDLEKLRFTAPQQPPTK